MMNVTDIRREFSLLKAHGRYVTDKTGCQMLEMIGATFLADEETIFAPVNHDYVERELQWYNSMSLNVSDIPGGAPKAWEACATPDGRINSNYGFLLFHKDNGSQYDNVLNELRSKPDSRRAIAIYTRPSMWSDYNRDGMSDFVCTNAVQYFIRDGKLVTLVQMRSNDIVWGFRNDYAWQRHVSDKLSNELNVPRGDIIWHAGSLHVYARHFHYVK